VSVQQRHLLGRPRVQPGARDLRHDLAGLLARVYPRAVLAWAIVGIPALVAAGQLPPPLSWIGWLVAFTCAAGAALGVATARRASVRAGLSAANARAVPLLVGGLLLGSALVVVVAPTILIVSALRAGLFGWYLVALTTLAILARCALMLPAVIGRGMPALEALELSWDLADGLLLEIAALLAALLVVALGPAVVVGAAAMSLGLSGPAALALASLALAVTGPLLPLTFAALLDPLEARRRDIDPSFGRP